jgi:hypothetical protein
MKILKKNKKTINISYREYINISFISNIISRELKMFNVFFNIFFYQNKINF